MAFRKRNVGIARTPSSPSSDPSSTTTSSTTPPSTPTSSLLPGTRPSPIDGRPVTSTGISSLDSLLAGHAGLALGTLLLIEENGLTDYGGVMLRMAAAEGAMQGQRVLVLGVGERWRADLPGVGVEKREGREGGKDGQEDRRAGEGKVGDAEDGMGEEKREKMKIAWRYERLGEFGGPGGAPQPSTLRRPSSTSTTTPSTSTPFTHPWDLTTRLPPTPLTLITTHPLSAHPNPFPALLTFITTHLHSTPTTVTRIILPSLLSPALYPATACSPTYLLPFLHGLRALCRKYAGRLVVMGSWPLALYGRERGVTRVVEGCVDGVVEISPFVARVGDTLSSATPSTSTSSSSKPPISKKSDKDADPQGLLTLHKLPIFHERGGGVAFVGGGGGELAFTVSRRRVWIREWSLPPVLRDEGAQEGTQGKELEF